ncbi:hypothetical protein BOTBODRAFT_29345 [Botryobasidium botryosum FD-172 SS1]|uniref:AAA+ ATPase domain-containing protein n=1 Tax=Botryobasidium botryosum (strain FD-172 SS1) TaxID=930990 RepID=A0A067N1J9_BOTB1|nr:hypothetical protein BOTBODRAFT_29345 [Botryobasidium botryosum FD-172 SS1]
MRPRSLLSPPARSALTARAARRFATSAAVARPRKSRSVLAESSTSENTTASVPDSAHSLHHDEQIPGRRARASPGAPKPPSKDSPLSLPASAHEYQAYETLWTPVADDPPSTGLPPPHILNDAVDNLLITLQPQVQHRAAYAPAPGSSLIEPTLALYCPIEGGDYIVDETVKELARRVGADVVVLDSVQLAAGEWGKLGKAASVLQFSPNPLQFTSTPQLPPSPLSSGPRDEDEDFNFLPAPPMFSIQIPSSLGVSSGNGASARSSRGGGDLSLQGSRTPTSYSKVQTFFNELVNVAPPAARGTTKDTSGPENNKRPRIIYVRDFGTLASSAPTWYPALLSAVRARRQGPIPRSFVPVNNPVTIVFGVTPPLFHPSNAPSPRPNLMSALMGSSRNAPSTRHSHSHSHSHSHLPRTSEAWDEEEHKMREMRLKERLKSWGRGDAGIRDLLPAFSHSATPEGAPSNLGAAGPFAGFLPASARLVSVMDAREGQGYGYSGGGSAAGRNPVEHQDGYFRVTGLVPEERDVERERAARVARRREINEALMRMAVGSVGGVLDQPLDEAQLFSEETSAGAGVVEGADEAASADAGADGGMWVEWGNRVEAWDVMKDVADRALGGVLRDPTLRAPVLSAATDPGAGSAASANATTASTSTSTPTLDPTPVPWRCVNTGWEARRAAASLTKTWMEKLVAGSSRELGASEDGLNEGEDEMDGMKEDEVVEQVKRDPDLDQHEQRLLGCIVNAASMPTTFASVHLPPKTIDSVRTLVSLPLLHPSAFARGILKTHSMTGALLFGPPGTGKTLVVQALARESGARMLLIKPSDVMDMYVGEGEKLVRSVFTLARRLSPCVIFLDEIDALFGARVPSRNSGGAHAHRGVITEFMQEMDGLKSNQDENVIVIGATNRPFDLDDAVLRRLPRRLMIDLPGEKEREEIMKILLRDEVLAPEVDLSTLAKQTESFSGSDLKHLCVSAALDAVKEMVHVPWNVPHKSTAPPLLTEASVAADAVPQSQDPEPASPSAVPEPESDTGAGATPSRIISLRHFTKALTEITPSSSESLGSLTDLRKWNEEFGEGSRRGAKRSWGDKFGFNTKTGSTSG